MKSNSYYGEEPSNLEVPVNVSVSQGGASQKAAILHSPSSVPHTARDRDLSSSGWLYLLPRSFTEIQGGGVSAYEVRRAPRTRPSLLSLSLACRWPVAQER